MRSGQDSALQNRLHFGDTKRKPRAVKVKAPVPTEAQIQMAFVHWTRLGTVRREFPELAYAFHVPNGEVRDKSTAAKLRAMGVQAGVADWIMLAPRGPNHGLIIEFKRRGKSVVTGSEQDAWMQYQKTQGFLVRVVTDWEKARDIVVAYLRKELA